MKIRGFAFVCSDYECTCIKLLKNPHPKNVGCYEDSNVAHDLYSDLMDFEGQEIEITIKSIKKE